jgi:branched-chain amino acid transport system ATP-binding protein
MILHARDIKKYYGEFCALDGVNLRLDAGEFVSIIGPNGAGKSTLVNVLTGLQRPSTGRVYFKDRDITGMGPAQLARLGMARSFQLVNIFPGLTVLEVLQVAVISRLRQGTHLFTSLARHRQVTAQALEVAELFALADKGGMLARQLPQGDKKLLDVASAFALHPEVILLDEPTSGVSTQDKHTIIEILVAAAKRIGIRSILQVEHDMDIVFGYSDRIVALYQGRVLVDSTPEQVRTNEEVVHLVVGHRGRGATRNHLSLDTQAG